MSLVSDPEPREAGEAAIKTIDRAARLLNILAGGDAGGLPLTELARQAEYGKGTTHRILAALSDVGFVFQDVETRRYRLGARLELIARKGVVQDIAHIAQPIAERLADQTGDTVYCSIREGLSAVCIARASGAFPIRTLTLDVGHRRPLGIGAGSLALLAASPDADAAITKLGDLSALYPGFTPEFLRASVGHTLRQGYALNDGRIIPGMSAVGVAVPAGRTPTPVAFSVAAIRERIEGERLPMLLGRLKDAVQAFSAQL